MIVIGLLFRPWMIRVQRMEGQPHVQADDILIAASGADAMERFIPAYNDTMSDIVHALPRIEKINTSSIGSV